MKLLSPKAQYRLRVAVCIIWAAHSGRELAQQALSLAKWACEPLKPKYEPFLPAAPRSPLAPLRWYHGPTDLDPDPGAMWCYDCDGRVYAGDGVFGCSGCGREDAGGVDDQAVTE